MLDIRKPIGYLFLIISTLLTLYSIVDPQLSRLEIVSAPAKSIELNLNFPCGLSMLIFAAIMLTLAYLDERRQKAEKQEQHPPSQSPASE